jgi:hypothetical protein
VWAAVPRPSLFEVGSCDILKTSGAQLFFLQDVLLEINPISD